MMLTNRIEAAKLLLNKLEHYKGENPLVLAIPRGAVPMAKIIADGLNGELGVVLVHKIPSPQNPELAVGSIGLSGFIDLMPFAKMMGVSEHYIQEAAKEQLDVLKARQKQYGLKDPNYKDRTVIIVDDGIATGATVLAAIHEIQHQKPRKIIVAAAVSSVDSAAKIREEVDELVTLAEPEFFYAVGQFFQDFTQVSDEEVINIVGVKSQK